jgi:hypothetical protein
MLSLAARRIQAASVVFVMYAIITNTLVSLPLVSFLSFMFSAFLTLVSYLSCPILALKCQSLSDNDNSDSWSKIVGMRDRQFIEEVNKRLISGPDGAKAVVFSYEG